MYILIRIVLILIVLAMGYVAVVTVVTIPYAWVAAVVAVIALLCKRRTSFSAYGTARFASIDDLPHMLEGNGLILGEDPPDDANGKGIGKYGHGNSGQQRVSDGACQHLPMG